MSRATAAKKGSCVIWYASVQVTASWLGQKHFLEVRRPPLCVGRIPMEAAA